MQNPSSPDLIRNAILAQALPSVAFDGWTWAVAQQGAVAAGYDKAMARAVFPGGLPEFVGQFSAWADREMLMGLESVDSSDLRVRDRIHLAVMTRLEILAPWREAQRRAATYWSVPHRGLQGGRLVWRSADAIWIWAGDTATDYNHYTKRALLAGVISATALAWLNDDKGDIPAIEDFLTRRIDHVLRLGKALGRFRKAA